MKDIYLDKEVMETLMQKMGIRFDSALLRRIAVELGEDPDDFVVREKSNFSKMLRRLRTVNPNYIVPLEKIFGTSILTMAGMKGYEIEDDPDAIPYLKPLRFFAYKDDPALYEELDKMTTPDGDKILFERDEYNRWFLDYVVEYGALNGVRFLVDKHGLCYDPIYRQLRMSDYFGTNDTQNLAFAMMLAKKDPGLFVQIYQPLKWLTDPMRGQGQPIFENPRLLRVLAENEEAIELLMEIKQERLTKVNPGATPKDGNDDLLIFANPMLLAILDSGFADEHIGQKIADFLSKHNRQVEENLRYPLREYSIDDRGFVRIGQAAYGNVLLPNSQKYSVYVPKIRKG